jgi:dihydrolipoamide dehydrogenase
MPDILPNLDQDVVKLLRDKYEKAGIRILTSTKVMSLNGNQVTAETSDGETLIIEAVHILISVGRRPNLDGLEALDGLEFTRKGINVDEGMRTNLGNVYAAGDITGKIMLAHVASRQAEVAVSRTLKEIPVQRIAYNAIPSVVYTNPEIASVGLTEADAADIPHDIHTMPMTFSGRFVAENEGETGLCKMLVDSKHHTVLGVHMIGNP